MSATRTAEPLTRTRPPPQRGIAVVRGKIKAFASVSVGAPAPGYPSPPYKLLILDEASGRAMRCGTATAARPAAAHAPTARAGGRDDGGRAERAAAHDGDAQPGARLAGGRAGALLPPRSPALRR